MPFRAAVEKHVEPVARSTARRAARARPTVSSTDATIRRAPSRNTSAAVCALKHVRRVVGDDVASVARPISDTSPRCPLRSGSPSRATSRVDLRSSGRTIVGVRRRSVDARGGESLAQRAHPRERRRGMSKERIEADLRRAGCRRAIGVVDLIDLRGQPRGVRRRARLSRAMRHADRGDRGFDARRTLGDASRRCAQSRRSVSSSTACWRRWFSSLTGRNRPVASPCASTAPSENGVSPSRPSCSRSSSASSGRLRRRRERDLAPHGHRVAVRREHRFERRAQRRRTARTSSASASCGPRASSTRSSRAPVRAAPPRDVRITRQPAGTRDARLDRLLHHVPRGERPHGGHRESASSARRASRALRSRARRPRESAIDTSTSSSPRSWPTTTPSSMPRLSGCVRVT